MYDRSVPGYSDSSTSILAKAMHAVLSAPSPWVVKHAGLIIKGGRVLDLACGNGRNAVWLAKQGFRVNAVDQNAASLMQLPRHENIQNLLADVESGPWPYPGELFDGIVVCNYLHRPMLALLATFLAPSGVLIYETFMSGNEKLGRPQNPDFLLKPDELLQVFSPVLDVVAFEQGEQALPKLAVMQKICAIRHFSD